MAVLNIALDMGTSHTSIYLEGNGVVIYEPTCVAFLDGVKQRNCIAVGEKARAMQGKSPERTIVVNPVSEGIVTQPEAAVIMLRSMLKNLVEPSMLLPHIKALVLIPCGLTIVERKTVEDVCVKAGIGEVTLMESIIAAAVGCDLPIASTNGGLIVNIGGGTTEIAAISLCGIINGCTVNIGGDAMDVAICDIVSEKYHLLIGNETARTAKEEIGSLFINDSAAAEVSGLDYTTKTPTSASVEAKDILDAVLPFYHRIADAIESIINVCPPEIASVIYKTGINLTGAACRILGLEQLLNARLKLAASVMPDAEYAVIVGGGKLLKDTELLEAIRSQN